MCISNTNNEPFYRVIPHLITSPTVLVTGSHYLYNEKTGKYIQVCNHPRAIKTNIIQPEFVCLITDDHKICLFDLMFWDWDDDKIPDKLK